uniref:Eka-PI kinase protein n=1 Tax=Euperipatoides kanangrensis TaxID=488523 RepID=A0A0F7VJF4_9BILA|nr:Eka-PI kinase protein [Euperipatoides kanangrensis]
MRRAVHHPWINAIMLVACLCLTVTGKVAVEFNYHHYAETSKLLQDLQKEYSQMAHLYSIGSSVMGRDIWVMAISANSPDKHVLGRPEVKYVANMHGNEAVGKELMLHFILHLASNYGQDQEITKLLNTTRIHLVPSMNPDGFENANKACNGRFGRENANLVDLNRNFPDQFGGSNQVIQPEVQAIINWLKLIPFVLSANFHGGAMVASYPYDSYASNKNNNQPKYSVAPDDVVFKYLALIYSKNHKVMGIQPTCKKQQEVFKFGITNGAAWYPLSGGMQDYNYVQAGCMEITLEVSCCKYPEDNELPRFWDENRKAMVEFLKQVHLGIKGIVKDELEKPISRAKIMVKNYQSYFYTTNDGEFWRILLPGTYTLEIIADGYNSYIQEITVPSLEAGPLILSVVLVSNIKPTVRDLFEQSVSSVSAVTAGLVTTNNILLTQSGVDLTQFLSTHIKHALPHTTEGPNTAGHSLGNSNHNTLPQDNYMHNSSIQDAFGWLGIFALMLLLWNQQ